jgi:ketosteroid isomerase-like protein
MKLLVAFFSILIVAALPRAGTALDAADSRDLEDHIWALEESYITAYGNADHDTILALMHERFLGWPDSEDRPTAYSQVPAFLRANYGEPGALDFTIDKAGIRIQGDVAITHYLLVTRANDTDAGGQTPATRITHTWIKEGKDWKILGGMSCVR